ncbi:LysR family transcriptional regulator [Mesorhizobium sp. NZP2298]|uniref:LysR family transcriptional regulator n=1 Tax=Mesorhizobium sp. NZP2298 TaxID=2483403 RepID=UPI001555E2FC|nr:LysR family transcriptional regulator [Mesorhizobium sp. NZP2298]
MGTRRHSLPSQRSLVTFECVARLMSFTRAADELNTSQPCVSRSIRELEAFVDARLFARTPTGIDFTEAGRVLYAKVSSGLEQISNGLAAAKPRGNPRSISILCNYDIAHLWLMPRYDTLLEGLGRDAELRVVTTDASPDQLLETGKVDIVLTCQRPVFQVSARKLLLEEEVFAVCSPAFAARHRTVLQSGDPRALLDLELLELNKQNFGWMTWDRWFGLLDVDASAKRGRREYSNYVYTLEAASRGVGLALGWHGLVERYLASGELLAPAQWRLKGQSGLHALMIGDGLGSARGRKVMNLLASLEPRKLDHGAPSKANLTVISGLRKA